MNNALMTPFRDRPASFFECFALTGDCYLDATLVFGVVDVMLSLLERRRVAS